LTILPSAITSYKLTCAHIHRAGKRNYYCSWRGDRVIGCPSGNSRPDAQASSRVHQTCREGRSRSRACIFVWRKRCKQAMFPPLQTVFLITRVSVWQLFDQLSNKKGTKLYQAQKRFQAALGFTMPIFWGRGIFNCSYSRSLLYHDSCRENWMTYFLSRAHQIRLDSCLIDRG
jgi:hypothetical protein